MTFSISGHCIRPVSAQTVQILHAYVSDCRLWSLFGADESIDKKSPKISKAPMIALVSMQSTPLSALYNARGGPKLR